MRRNIVQIDYGFICLVCLLYLFDKQNLLPLTLLAATVHECGHILMVYLVGHRISQLRLTVFGACIELNESHRISYRKELLIAAGGPLFGGLCAVLFAAQFPIFSGIGFCLSLFNLLPIAPLDGGKILRCVLCAVFDVDLVDVWMKRFGVALGIFLAIAVIFLSGSVHCTVGMILFSAFLIRMCLL